MTIVERSDAAALSNTLVVQVRVAWSGSRRVTRKEVTSKHEFRGAREVEITMELN